MQKTVQAIFVKGAFQPTKRIDWIEENERVTVTVTVPNRVRPLEGWVGAISDEDAQEMLRAIDME